MPFFLKALSLAMDEFPMMNTVVSPELDSEGLIKEYVIKESHNYAIAVDSREGLTTPVLKGINHKSIKQINTDLKSLVRRTNDNQLTLDDFQDGTFSVSSVGNIGGRYFVPTILRPQAAIIAIGRSRVLPR